MKTMFRRDVATSSGRQKWAANCSTQRSESQYDILKSLYELGDLQDGRSIAAGLQVISATARIGVARLYELPLKPC